MDDRFDTSKLYEAVKQDRVPDFGRVKIVDGAVFGTSPGCEVLSVYGYDWMDTIEARHNGFNRATSYLLDIVSAVYRAQSDIGNWAVIADFRSGFEKAASESKVLSSTDAEIYPADLAGDIYHMHVKGAEMPAGSDLSVLLSAYGELSSQFPGFDAEQEPRNFVDRIKSAIRPTDVRKPTRSDAFNAILNAVERILAAEERGLVEIGHDRRATITATLEAVVARLDEEDERSVSLAARAEELGGLIGNSNVPAMTAVRPR